jgi:hypothetical protein
MHGLDTGNTLLTAAAVAASRSKALIWSVSAISKAVLPYYDIKSEHVITQIIIFGEQKQ